MEFLKTVKISFYAIDELIVSQSGDMISVLNIDVFALLLMR